MTIRPAGPSDLPELIAIAHSCGPAAHWSEQQWRDIFHSQNPERLALIAEEEPATLSAAAQAAADATAAAAPPSRAASTPRPIGFAVAQCAGPDWELENIAVLPAFRCRGAGQALAAELLLRARARGAERVLLEVRASNHCAIRLYERTGFHRLARRSGYYSNPAEDALILVHPLNC